MSFLQQFYPGDFITWAVALVLIQMTCVIGVAAVVARLVARRGAAARYGVWFCALACVVLCPLLAIGGHQMGLTIVAIPIQAMPSVLPPSLEVGGEVSVVAKDFRTPDVYLPASSAVTSSGAKAPKLVIDDNRRSHGQLTTTVSSESSSPSDDRIPAGGSSTIPRDRIRAACGALTLIWSIGVLFLFARMLREIRRVRLLRRDAQPLDDDRYATVLIRVNTRLGVGHPGKIAVSPRAPMPLTVGLWNSTVLVPDQLLSTLSETELEDVLVHECAHNVRRDLVIGLVQRLFAILYWPHPLIHFLNRRLSRAREEVCDNYVLRSGDAGTYAHTLLTVAEHITAASAVSAGIGLFPTHWKLEDRVAGLLDKGRILMTRTNRLLLASLFAALATTGIVISGVRLGEVAADETDKTRTETTASAADQPDNETVEEPGMREFTFDKLIVKVDSFAAPSNYTLTIQKDSSYVFQPFTGSDNSSRNRLPSTSMAQLEDLLKKADYMKEPSIEELATDSRKKGLVELIKRTRAKNPDDPAIRSYKFSLRAAPGVGMASDGTWFTFTLVRDGEKRVLSRYNEELKLPPIQQLVRFTDRILKQEEFEQGITGEQERVLLNLNLHLDRALGRRDVKSPPPLPALDYGGLAVRLQKLAAGDDPRLASRAQRAIRTIRQLPGDFSRPSAPIPPADVDRLATFRIFTLDLKGDGDEQQQLWVSPDGWYEFRIIGPPNVTEYLLTVRYRHVDRLPRKTLDRLDQLIVATRHFRSQYGGHKITKPSRRGVYYMAVGHEHDRGSRRMVSHRAGQAAQYDNLQDFLTTQIVGLMKRKVPE